jgi:hypothetical protein
MYSTIVHSMSQKYAHSASWGRIKRFFKIISPKKNCFFFTLDSQILAYFLAQQTSMNNQQMEGLSFLIQTLRNSYTHKPVVMITKDCILKYGMFTYSGK